jgi:hypothetical protein
LAYNFIRRNGTLILVILIAASAIFDFLMWTIKISEGIFWAVIGIEFTAIVGVVIFLMQMKVESRINELFEKEHEIVKKHDERYTRSKSYLCRQIIENLNSFKKTYVDVLYYVENFEKEKTEPKFLIEMRHVIVLKNIKIKRDFSPTIKWNTALLMDKLDETELGIQLSSSVDRLHGAILEMVEAYLNNNDLYCGLGNPIVAKSYSDLIKEYIQEIDGFIVKIENEMPEK